MCRLEMVTPLATTMLSVPPSPSLTSDARDPGSYELIVMVSLPPPALIVSELVGVVNVLDLDGSSSGRSSLKDGPICALPSESTFFPPWSAKLNFAYYIFGVMDCKCFLGRAKARPLALRAGADHRGAFHSRLGPTPDGEGSRERKLRRRAVDADRRGDLGIRVLARRDEIRPTAVVQSPLSRRDCERFPSRRQRLPLCQIIRGEQRTAANRNQRDGHVTKTLKRHYRNQEVRRTSSPSRFSTDRKSVVQSGVLK